VDAPLFFVDEMRFALSFWHHQHRSLRNRNGVTVEDIIHYAIKAAGGTVLNARLGLSAAERIFAFRSQPRNAL